MSKLPSDYELQKLVSAGWTSQQIADKYNVSRQGAEYRLHKMNIHKKGPKSPVASALPWDIANHPNKRSLIQKAPFRGLRAYLLRRMGESLSQRAELDLRAFLNRVRGGEVLALEDGRGLVYVPREARDGNLVIRWPAGVPRGERVTLFVDDELSGAVSGTQLSER